MGYDRIVETAEDLGTGVIKVRIIGGSPATIEVDGVDLARAISMVEVIMEPHEEARVRLTVIPDELVIELDGEVVRILDSLPVDKAEDGA